MEVCQKEAERTRFWRFPEIIRVGIRIEHIVCGNDTGLIVLIAQQLVILIQAQNVRVNQHSMNQLGILNADGRLLFVQVRQQHDGIGMLFNAHNFREGKEILAENLFLAVNSGSTC